MNRFEVGRSYGVLHLGERREAVTVASRDQETVTLEDGRKARILHGASHDGTAEEVLRLGEVGAVATGGVVRVCHLL